MNAAHQHNLDYQAARRAQELIGATAQWKAKEVDNTVTKALGVLQEDGVYACFLYLLAREKERGRAVIAAMLDLLNDLGLQGLPAATAAPDRLLDDIAQNVTQDLPTLLLAREALERMLIYARYGAKARQRNDKEAT